MIKFSCCSKVLIIGGYAILDSENIGISLGTNIRFKSMIEGIENYAQQIQIHIESCSDFQDFYYNVDINSCEIQCQRQNNFIQSSLEIFYQYLKLKNLDKHFKSLKIKLDCDQGFYSQNSRKTGLGSSACVIVNIIGSLLLAYDIYDINLLNFLSQMANNQAQNKIGSGFDINTCIYGTQIFQKSHLNVSNQVSDYSKNLQNLQFDPKRKIKFPSNLKIIMIDINTGSDTRILVKDVQNYLNKHPEEKQIFYEQSNLFCKQILSSLNTSNFDELKKINRKYRQLIQNLSNKSFVEIEPQIYTKLLDQLLDHFKEIVYAVCPGAGGYDAACLIVQKVLKIEQVQNYLQEIKSDFQLSLIETEISNDGVIFEKL